MATLAAIGVGQAQEDDAESGWSDTAELTYVHTGGNAEASTLGFRNTLARAWDSAKLTFTAGGIRTESTTTRRSAIGSIDEFEIQETSVRNLTAESYYLRSRYDRSLSDRVFAFGGAGWERNTFAGIANRYNVVAGVGNIWFEDESSRFRTDYGLTYTKQTDVIEIDGVDDTFIGFRASWDYWRELSPNTDFESILIVDDNLERTADLRVNLTTALAVSMSERLAFKATLQLLYDAEPALFGIALQRPAGVPTGDVVFAALDRLDSLFTVALAVNF